MDTVRDYTEADYPVVAAAVARDMSLAAVAAAFRAAGLRWPVLNPQDGRRPEPYARLVDAAICRAFDARRAAGG